MKEQKLYQCLSGSTLKWIAMASMVVDHFAAVLIYQAITNEVFSKEQYSIWYVVYNISRAIGRIAFPIFCFLLVEGFCHTRSRKRYITSLFLFALLSELPFDLAFSQGNMLKYQNVFFTLFLGSLVLWGLEFLNRHKIRGGWNVYFFAPLVVIAGALAAYWLNTDYSYWGILLISIFYFLKSQRVMAGIVGFLIMCWESACFPAFLLIQCYNGKRGMRLKYFFYIFYPAHLLILYFIARLLGFLG